MSKQFKRTDFWRFSRLGMGRKKKQVWRRAEGVQSKIRRKKRGYPIMPSIGLRTPRAGRNKVENAIPILIHNVADLQKLKKGSVVIMAKIGARKKLDVLKKAEELQIKIINQGRGRNKK
jgi:large subunit ribosomal protein L32e